VAREGSQLIAGLAEERLRHLAGALSADNVPEVSRDNAMTGSRKEIPSHLRTWLDDYGFVAAFEQVKQSRTLDPDLGVHVHAIESKTHDRFPRDAWEEIEAAARRRSTSTMPEPFPGADSWLAAQNAYKQYLPERALVDAQRAASMFSDVAPAWSARAMLLAVACEFRLQRFDEALETLPRLRKLAALRGWTDLEARTYWLEGLIHHQQGDPIAARSLWRKGQDEFASAGEPGFVGALLALEAMPKPCSVTSRIHWCSARARLRPCTSPICPIEQPWRSRKVLSLWNARSFHARLWHIWRKHATL
jgi:hypothetical protein